ncbi:hypothetical protein E4U42_000378 [Claviceps africana]|uniref:Protein kinase domain-containing protein n=1 Tax=Claviceps africana TaxID=83212 RepID=A0A8K0NHV3_9HYPO|nr:hypothetical protein E4U42_000378 [Claviceps africana]
MSLQSCLTAWLKALASRLASIRLLLMRPIWHMYKMLRNFKSTPESTCDPGPCLISLGGTGLVFKLTDTIAVKKSQAGRSDYIVEEQKIFEILNRQPLSPYIIQDFHNTHDAIFMEYMPGGCLRSVLSQGQIRDETGQLLRVETVPAEQDCLRWMRQLAAAAAWLENLGLAHCDIRPANILLSSARNVKLADFDRTHTIGHILDALTEPFARLLGHEGGEEYDTFGKAGSRTEQFAIGSVLFTLTRGHEPYELEAWGREHGLIQREKLQAMEFPTLGSKEKYDEIVGDCWHGRYESIAQLSNHIASLDQHSSQVIEQQLSPSDIESRKRECEKWVESGILEELHKL